MGGGAAGSTLDNTFLSTPAPPPAPPSPPAPPAAVATAAVVVTKCLDALDINRSHFHFHSCPTETHPSES